jgi:hypothetical protein
VNLHKFRASRTSELARSVSESVLCKLGGLEQNSSQLPEYIFLSGADVDKEILRVNGLLKEEDIDIFVAPENRRIIKNDAEEYKIWHRMYHAMNVPLPTEKIAFTEDKEEYGLPLYGIGLISMKSK